MQCPRCGTLFEGRYCPQCGAPAGASAAPPSAVCSRCFTSFEGNFCPACGMPRFGAQVPVWPAPPGYGVAPVPSGIRSFGSLVWLGGIVVFALLLASNFATLGVAAPLIVDGIANLRTGSTQNADFGTGIGSWSFFDLGTGATGAWMATGGNPGGFAQASFAGNASGTFSALWTQSFDTVGSSPFASVLRFDFRVFRGSAQAVSVRAFLERVPGAPAGPAAYTISDASAAAAWTAATELDSSTGDLTTRIDLGSAVRDPGTYYVKILVGVVFGPAPTGTTVVGLDNLQVRWGTNAGIVFFLLLPPTILAQTRDHGVFLGYFSLVVISLVAALVVQLAVDARPMSRLLRAPPENLAGRLRARVGFTTLAQVFLASFSFQVVFIIILNSVQVPTPSPLDTNTFPPWFILFELANAPVFEEVISRLLLIGVPLFAASIALRARWILLHRDTPRRWRYIVGSLRFLYGGNVTRNSPVPTLIGAGVLLALSSAVFGLAHQNGYGDWKILPAAVGGLALGYLYLRHGLATAILAHFAQDYFSAIFFAPSVPDSWAFALDLLFFIVLIAGAGFFVYYVWYASRLLDDITARFRGPRAVPTTTPPEWPAPGAVGGAVRVLDPHQDTVAPPPVSPPVVVPPGYAPPGRPPPYGSAPVQFRCPRCGWIEARYDQGRFTCLRCGHAT